MKIKKYKYRIDKEKVLSLINSIQVDSNELKNDDVKRTHEFIHSIFEEYEKPGLIEDVKFAFIIPTRASRFSKDYWGEVYDFLPALRFMSLKEAFAVVSSLPPFRIEMYGPKVKKSSGVLIFAPIFDDMRKDYKSRINLLRKVRKTINETVEFAVNKFNVEYVGLGATLPKLTNFGKTIKADVTTTTGHAGTTWLIKELVKKIVNEKDLGKEFTIGFIGGGSIGISSIQSLSKIFPLATFYIYDKRSKVNNDNKHLMDKAGKDLFIAKSNKDLLEKCEVIVSAITSKINLDGVDLTGKVIIDDSQPGSFDREEVNNHGGELIWVVGKDSSKEKFVSRRLNYSFGPKGLFHNYDLWGCEAEVAALAHSDRKDLAISRVVQVNDVETIGSLLKELGIVVADYQSHGELNN